MATSGAPDRSADRHPERPNDPLDVRLHDRRARFTADLHAFRRGRQGATRAPALVGLLLVAALAATGCKGCGADPGVASSTSTTAGRGSADASPPAAPLVAGTATPSPRLGRELAARLEAGFKAQRAHRLEEARAAFAEVVAAAPDHAPARHALLRAAALAGDFDEATRQYGELLARDYPGYAARLDSAAARKELAAWRASPAWPRAEGLRAAALAAWGAGLDQGFFHVARTGPPAPGRLRQDAFFYDAAHDRYRRLTDLGKVYALAVAPDRAALALLLVDEVVAPAAARGTEEGQLVRPRAALLDLATLTLRGPFPLGAEGERLVQLGFDAAGRAQWWCGDAQYGISDGASAHDGGTVTAARLVKSPAGPPSFGPGGATLADPDSVGHSDGDRAGATLSPDGLTLTVPGRDRPLRAARPLDAAALAWSPGRGRLAFAGVLDPCRALASPHPGPDDGNELFVWERDHDVTSRIASGASRFASAWLDGDRLAFEGGEGAAARLHLRTVSTRDERVLAHRYGAGLHGLPTLRCVPPPPAEPAEPPDPASPAEPLEPATPDEPVPLERPR